MLTALRIQFKSLSKDKMVWVSGLFPIILAICIKLYGGNIIIEDEFGYIKGQITGDKLAGLEAVVNLTSFEDEEGLNNFVLADNTDGVGVLYDDTTQRFSFVLQGNELSLEENQLNAIGAFLSGEVDFDRVKMELILEDKNYLVVLLVTLTILMGLFLGAVFNAFNIVTEKEERINLINRILPTSRVAYIIQKSIIGFLASLLLSFATIIIVIGWSFPLLETTVLLLLGSILSTLVGLYLGHFCTDQILVIIMTKVVLLVFTFVPFIGFMIPAELSWVKNMFYIIPSYPVFNGIWAVVKGEGTNLIWFNSLIVLLYSVIGLLIYWKLSKKERITD